MIRDGKLEPTRLYVRVNAQVPISLEDELAITNLDQSKVRNVYVAELLVIPTTPM